MENGYETFRVMTKDGPKEISAQEAKELASTLNPAPITESPMATLPPTIATLIEAANEAELQASVARAELAATRERAQRFFAVLAAEMRRPSFGEQSAGIIRALLLRAEEASLYSPTLETP